VWQLMDALGVKDICVKRTWKVSSAEVKLRGVLQDTQQIWISPIWPFNKKREECCYQQH